MTVDFHQGFNLETTQRITKWNTAHAELARYLGLGKALARNQQSLPDRPPQLLGHRFFSGDP